MKRLAYIVFTLLAFTVAAPAAFADTATPAISSFTANTSSVNNGTSAGLTWTMTNSTGNSILFLCPTGVTVTTDSGSAVACNTRVSAGGGSANTTAGFTFYNISGASKQVQVRLYPKDANMNDVEASRDLYVTVNPAVRPLHDLTLSTTTIGSGGSATLSWSSVYIPGVNIRFDCVTDVTVSASDGGEKLPCNVPAFSTDLSANGSQTIFVTNRTGAVASLPITVLPSIQSGMYDGGNSISQTLTVLVPPPAPEVTLSSVAVSTQTLASGKPLTISWATKNATGANVQVSCTSGITFSAADGTTIPCGVPAFSTALPAVGTTSISMKNSDTFSRHSVLIYILAQKADGTYVLDSNRALTLNVMAAGESVPAFPTTTPAVTPPVPTTTPTPKTGTMPVQGALPKWNLTSALGLNTKNAQVTSLQTFLAQDPTLYPEKAVTGFFGPATKRAVGAFQKRYGIAKEGDSAFGFVGPATRAKINSLVRP